MPEGSSSTEIGANQATVRISVAPVDRGDITSNLLTQYDIREVSYQELDDEELEPIVAGVNAIGAEREPRHVDVSVEEFRIFNGGPGAVRSNHVAYDSADDPVAFLNLRYPDDGSSPRLLRTSISVLSAHRRRGLGTSLLDIAVNKTRDLGRDLLSGAVFDTVPAGEAFAKAVGGTKTLDFHSNTLRINHLDLDMLREWRAQGPLRGPGYSVEVVEDMYPDEILEGVAHLYLVLERDMPQPENWEPREFTPELVKAWVGNYLKGVELLTAIAFEDRTGAPVGMSQLGRRRSDDKTWFVTTTMVDPEHRGHALGKWVKATACLEALERWPGAKWMETGNAFTNEPMLGINHAMGFEHEYTLSDVQVTIDVAEAYLASRTA